MPDLPWVEVQSSNVRRVAHLEEGDTPKLYVEFHRDDDDDGPGPVYEYAGVDRDRYFRLINAESVGSMYSKIIRGRFPYARVAEDESDELDELKRRVQVLERDMENIKKGMRALITARPVTKGAGNG